MNSLNRINHLQSYHHPTQSPREDPLTHFERALMTQTNSWLLQTPVLPVLASPTTKAANKDINFYLSYRSIWPKSFFTCKVDSRCKTQLSGELGPWCPWVPKTEGEKRSQTKIKTNKPLFFLRLVFILSLRMETCLPPALSLCKTK